MRPLKVPPRLDIARLPTPIHALERLSAAWGGPKLWLKRDDETGGVLSGNKIRKLQYAVHEAIETGADTLVTCGGIQSNHCRATATLARLMGLDVVLVLRGEPPERLEGNLLLDRLMGADIRWITPEEYRDKDDVLDAVAQELREQGRKPYVVAEGCSMAIGSWGYIEAAGEIAQFERDENVQFDAILHAVGSGGTSAGLELGARLFGLKRVWGINVCDDEDYFRPLIHRIATQTIERFGLDLTLDLADVGLIDGHVGLGYGMPRPEELQTLVEVARSEGIVFDPVYTGKAFHGLRRELATGRFADAKNLLFVHTGGVYGLFPHAEALPLE